MIVMNVNDREARSIVKYPYKGKDLPVKDVHIRWLSKVPENGEPEYGLRYFTIGPSGHIALHNHRYVQTMFILSGKLSVAAHDPDTDEIVEEKIVGPTDFVFVPTMEPHSMKNVGDEPVTLLCCIANVYEQDTI